MNKNNQNYKETFSAFEPSKKAVERVFEITTDKRKFSKNVIFRRAAAAMLAFVFVIGGGFGLNLAVNRKVPTYETLGVMVAVAGERNLLEAGKANEQDVFYGIYVADLKDSQAVTDAKNRWNSDKNKQLDIAQKLGTDNITAGVKSGNGEAYNKKLEKYTATMYTLSAGGFVLNLSDYSNVKDITVENTSRYGMLYAEYWNKNYDLNAMDTDIYHDVFGEKSTGFVDLKECSFGSDTEKIVFTKDELQFSVENNIGVFNTTDGEVKKGYTIEWEPSAYLNFSIGDNVNFDLTQIKDTILFTVNYDDGTSEQASVSLAFDGDGYMHIVDAD